MASKIKVDTIETADGTGDITVNNNLVVTTMTSTGNVNFSQEVHLDSAKKMKFKANGRVSGSRYWQIRNDDSGYGWLGFKYSDSTSDENYTSSLQLTSDGRGLSQFTAKAWVNFDGTGTVAIRDSHNVSSITDNATGEYRVNFTNAMANDLYSCCVTGTGAQTSSGYAQLDSDSWGGQGDFNGASTTWFNIRAVNGQLDYTDHPKIVAVVFGD